MFLIHNLLKLDSIKDCWGHVHRDAVSSVLHVRSHVNEAPRHVLALCRAVCIICLFDVPLLDELDTECCRLALPDDVSSAMLVRERAEPKSHLRYYLCLEMSLFLTICMGGVSFFEICFLT